MFKDMEKQGKANKNFSVVIFIENMYILESKT